MSHRTHFDHMSTQELKQQWRLIYAHDPPTRISRQLLIRALYFHHENQRHPSAFSPSLTLHINKYQQQLEQSGDITSISAPPAIKAGTRLLRTWQGQDHEVTVTAEGHFEWRGDVYSSLSKIARMITGTRRNGPAFFGLRE